MAKHALEKLVQGNQRFVAGESVLDCEPYSHRDAEALKSQKPFAIIVACSDSRVPVEAVFDQGIGDLFVVRVAGNVIARSQLGTIEFGVEVLGPRLVVVLGHSGCAAVLKSLASPDEADEGTSDNLDFILKRIREPVRELVDESQVSDKAELENLAIEANVRHAVGELYRQSELIREYLRRGDISVAGAVYDISSGEVRFLDV